MSDHPLERPPFDLAAEGDTMGVRHVQEALRDLPFPATRREVLARAGEWRIPITGAHFHRMADFLEGVPDRRYRSADALARAVAKAHPEQKG